MTFRSCCGNRELQKVGISREPQAWCGISFASPCRRELVANNLSLPIIAETMDICRCSQQLDATPATDSPEPKHGLCIRIIDLAVLSIEHFDRTHRNIPPFPKRI